MSSSETALFGIGRASRKAPARAYANTFAVTAVLRVVNTEQAVETGGREIRDVALLDLTGAHSAAALEGVTRISRVATILVPESLLARLSSIPLDRVASTIPVPDGKKVKVFTGQITLSGEALANADTQDSQILVIVGQLIITSPVQQVGYSDLIVVGQLVAPTGSETALGTGVSRLTGQVVYYPYTEGASIRLLSGTAVSGEALANTGGQPGDILLATSNLVITSPIAHVGYQQVLAIGHVVVPKDTDPTALARITPVGGQVATYTTAAPPRVFDGKDHFSAGFFELLDEPTTLVLDGSFSFDEDVPPELLRQKVASIIFDGRLRAPRRLIPVLQLLSVVRDGVIQQADEPE